MTENIQSPALIRVIRLLLHLVQRNADSIDTNFIYSYGIFKVIQPKEPLRIRWKDVERHPNDNYVRASIGNSTWCAAMNSIPSSTRPLSS